MDSVEQGRINSRVNHSRELVQRRIIGMRVDATSYEDAADRICSWARSGESRYVCAAAVNNVIEARDHVDFRRIMNEADLVTPDGRPLVWGLRLLGVPHASQVAGTHLTGVLCARAADEGVPVGFLGGTPEVLDALVINLHDLFPQLRVVYRHSPPFRPLDPAEEEATVEEIALSGARILFVGLGAPKQEHWMARHRGRVDAVMVGVGAAFDFLSGQKNRAPTWVQRLAMEWLYRLLQEPRRLWKRYLLGNPRFIALLALQLVRADGGRSKM
jgi:N-acetylglucosaminyldiphosphoundecaprenol N-acetyl-beta-D-mannosaminyltransferase